jgi:predicted amidophosphoribosyltransferase
MPTCSNCGAQQPDGAAFCDDCGAALGAPQVSTSPSPAAGQARTVVASSVCPVCGAQTSPQDPFCTNCGASLGEAPQVAAAPPQVAAAPPSPPVGATVVAGIQNAGFPPGAPTASETFIDQGAPMVAGALTCSNCGAALEPDSAFCDMCGAPVRAPAGSVPSEQGTQFTSPEASGPPPEWASAWQAQPAPPVMPAAVPASPVPPPIQVSGKFIVPGTNASLPFPPGRVEVLIGREDPVSGIFPDIDLTDYGGDEGGVSRKHARITVQGAQFFIEDLNSVNHTFVNREQLVFGDQRPLLSGDEISLGRVKLIFQIS